MSAAGKGRRRRRRAERRPRVVDPVVHSPWAWGQDPQTGIAAVRLDGVTIIALVAAPAVGLYVPVLIHISGLIAQLCIRPCDFWEAVEHAHWLIKGYGARILASKQAAWRQGPATHRQIELLGRLAPELAARARRQRWTADEVSRAITARIAALILAERAPIVERMMA